MTVALAWGLDMLGLDWSSESDHSDLAYARRYLTMLGRAGCSAFVSNAAETEIGVALLNGRVAIPLTRPTVRRQIARAAYTSSAYSHFVYYLA